MQSAIIFEWESVDVKNKVLAQGWEDHFRTVIRAAQYYDLGPLLNQYNTCVTIDEVDRLTGETTFFSMYFQGCSQATRRRIIRLIRKEPIFPKSLA